MRINWSLLPLAVSGEGGEQFQVARNWVERNDSLVRSLVLCFYQELKSLSEFLNLPLHAVLALDHGLDTVQNDLIFASLFLHQCLGSMNSRKDPLFHRSHILANGLHLVVNRVNLGDKLRSHFFNQANGGW